MDFEAEMRRAYGWLDHHFARDQRDEYELPVTAGAWSGWIVRSRLAEEAVRLKDAEIARMREVRNDNAEEWRAEVRLCRERIAELEEAVRLEREACAKVCEARIDRLVEMKAAKFADGAAYYDHRTLNGDIGCLTDIAAAIRSRSKESK